MSSYKFNSLSYKDDIVKLNNKFLRILKKTDKSVIFLNKLLDKKLKYAKSLQSLKKGKINQIEKIIDDLSNIKVQISVKNYDIIDQIIKSIDNELVLLEKTILHTDSADLIKKMNDNKQEKPDESLIKKRKMQSNNEAYPSEPVYCICKRIAFGDMIACDNEDCPIEWFHYPCVNLTRKPRNSWVCSYCSNKNKKLKKN